MSNGATSSRFGLSKTLFVCIGSSYEIVHFANVRITERVGQISAYDERKRRRGGAERSRSSGYWSRGSRLWQQSLRIRHAVVGWKRRGFRLPCALAVVDRPSDRYRCVIIAW